MTVSEYFTPLIGKLVSFERYNAKYTEVLVTKRGGFDTAFELLNNSFKF